MALDATIRKEPSNLVGISDGSIRFWRARATDQAADGFGLCHAHRFTVEQFVECELQVLPLRLVFDVTDAELIIDATGIANSPLSIEHDHARRAINSELVGNAIADIFEHRKAISCWRTNAAICAK